MKNKINFVTLCELLVVITVILDLNSMYDILLRMVSNVRISFFCVLFLILLIFFKRKKMRCRKNTFCFLAIFIMGLILINSYLNIQRIATVIIYYTAIFFLFYIYFSSNGEDSIISIIDKFVKIVFVLSLVSMVMWLCADIFKFIKPTGKIFINVRLLWRRIESNKYILLYTF